MQRFAEYRDGQFFRLIQAEEKPADIPHKGVAFYPVTEQAYPDDIDTVVTGQQAALVDGVHTVTYATATRPYDQSRRMAYDAEGCDMAALTVALREAAEDPPRPAALEAIQAKVAEIKARYPKPV